LRWSLSLYIKISAMEKKFLADEQEIFLSDYQ